MYTRILSEKLKYFSTKYPVVTLLGPRQAGKTTLVKNLFNNLPYVNLEELEKRELANSDPKYFLEMYPDGAIFDEIQRAPELLSAIQVRVDAIGKKGMYILTGSHQVQLHSAVGQSLAGRTSILRLLPLSLQELEINNINFENQVILQGGYPRIYVDDLDITNAYSSYFQTYVERDVRSIINIKDLLKFEKFIKLLAARVGQIINYSSLAIDVGVSAITIKEWVSVLESSYLIFRLDPYFENLGKRLIKSPKIYFTDTGLLCYLLGLDTAEQLNSSSIYGSVFENLVILELYKYCYNHVLEPRFYFYRDVSGKEVDILYQKGTSLIPIEIKSSKSFSSKFFNNIDYFHSQSLGKAESGVVIYCGSENHKIKNYKVLKLQECTNLFT